MKHLLTFFLFSTLISCTVTKRQHRGGYHIEWRKNYSTSSNEQKEKQKVESHKEANQEILITAEPNNQTLTGSEIVIIDEVSVENLPEQSTKSYKHSLIPEITESSKNTIEKTKTQRARPIYFNDASIENMRKAGWIIMGVGLFLFLCVLLASAPGITAAGSIGQLILYIIFALLGLLMILLFGPVGAFIFTLCVALAGVVIALVAMGIQKRRKRFYEPE
jgi:hypothetical protein